GGDEMMVPVSGSPVGGLGHLRQAEVQVHGVEAPGQLVPDRPRNPGESVAVVGSTLLSLGVAVATSRRGLRAQTRYASIDRDCRPATSRSGEAGTGHRGIQAGC